MLDTDGQADGALLDAGVRQLLRRHLRVGRVIRMDDKALDIRHIGQQGEDLEIIDELICFVLSALDIKGKDGAAAVGEIFLIQGVIGMIRQGRMIDLFHMRVGSQIFHDFGCILRVPFQTQGQSLQALQQDPGADRGDTGAGITEQDGPDISHESRGTGRLYKGNTVVAGVGFRKLGEFAAGRPVELTAVYDDTAQRGAVAANELGRRMDDHICSMLDRADHERSAKGIVNDQGKAIFMGDFR